MTLPQMERRVYEKDEPQLFKRLETLAANSGSELEVDGVHYHLEREGDDTVGIYYLLTPDEGQAAPLNEEG